MYIYIFIHTYIYIYIYIYIYVYIYVSTSQSFQDAFRLFSLCTRYTRQTNKIKKSLREDRKQAYTKKELSFIIVSDYEEFWLLVSNILVK